MYATIFNQDGSSYPSYLVASVKLAHPNGMQLTLTETPEGFKVIETGRNDAGLSVRPSSSNSITIEN